MFSRFKNFVSEKIDTAKKDAPPAQPTPTKESPPPAPVKQEVTEQVAQPQEPVKQLSTNSAPAPKATEKLPEAKIIKTTNSIPSFSFDSIFRQKKLASPVDYDIPLNLWKTVPSNNGLFLIRKYENTWNMTHENNIDLARAAERTDRKLHTVITTSNKNFKALKDFEQVILTLPTIVNQLSKLAKQVDEIRSRCTTLEEVFGSLATARYEKATGKWKKVASDNSLNYSDAKKEELIRLEYKLQIEKEKAEREESIRLNLLRLEQERKERLEKLEQERVEKLEQDRIKREEQERLDKIRSDYEREQQAFEKAFKQQMENFLETGGASIENIAPIKVDTSLEELQVDDDNADLENFLGSDDDEGDVGDHGNSDDDDNHIEVLPIIDEPDLEYKPIKNPLILE